MQTLLFTVSAVLLFVFVAVGGTIRLMRGVSHTERWLRTLKVMWRLSVIDATSVVGAYCGIVLCGALTLLLMRHMEIREKNIFIAGGIVLIGVGAYWLKTTNKKWFGIVELGFAWFSAVTISLDVKSDITFAQGLGIVGTVYLVAESLEYCFEGRRKEREFRP